MWYDPLMTWLLKSPLHPMVSKGVMLISVTGRKSGRTISTPTNYLRDANTLWVISWRARKWWRNLRGGAPARVLLQGKTLEGRAQLFEDQEQVGQKLFEYYRRVPRFARYVGIGLDAAGQPKRPDCAKAAQEMVVVQVTL